MILEAYLLYQEYQKKKIEDQKLEEQRLQGQKDIVLGLPVASSSLNSTLGSSTTASNKNQWGGWVFIFLIMMIFISIFITIMCIFFLYKCIQKGCLGFLMVVIIIFLLNIPVINIAMIVILFFWWWEKCRGNKSCNSSI